MMALFPLRGGEVFGQASHRKLVDLDVFLLSSFFPSLFERGGEIFPVVTTKRNPEEAAIAGEQALLDRSPEAAREEFVPNFPQSGDSEQQPKSRSIEAFSKEILSKGL